MKRKIFTLLLGVIFGGIMVAQTPNVDIKRTATAPVVDGVIEALWDTITPVDIALPYGTETPTLGATGETTWKMVWDDNGLYILLQVADDVFSPCYTGCNNWEWDKPEIYFDCNYNLQDGKGASAGAGHYQVAPGFVDGENDGTVHAVGTDGTIWAAVVTDPSYIAEYFVPFTRLVDADGNDFIKTNPMGFDVTIIDNDEAAGGTAVRNRACWSNDGTTGTVTGESWNSMDGAGTITLTGVPVVILATGVTVTAAASTITLDNDTLRLVATVAPAEASNKAVKWSVTPVTGNASIDADGLLSATKNGVVTVTAMAKDGSGVFDTYDVTISNQYYSKDEANILKNGTFEANDGTGFPPNWGGWLDGSAQTMEVSGGVMMCGPKQWAEAWHYQLSQSGNDQGWALYNDTSYVVIFDAWADADRVIVFDFEDSPGNNYERYGDSPDANSTGKSEWNVNLTTTQTTFTQYVTMKRLVDNSLYKIQYMLSADSTPVYLDNIYLFTIGDQELVANLVPITGVTVTSAGDVTEITSGSNTLQMSAVVAPADATVQNVIWSVVSQGGSATIDANGLLTATGDGSVKVIAEAGDHQGVSAEKIISINTGVNNLNSRAFRMYPNPVVNVLNVDLTQANSTIAIYNGVGQKVYEMVATGKATINVRDFAQGVYFVRVNGSAAQKFVK